MNRFAATLVLILALLFAAPTAALADAGGVSDPEGDAVYYSWTYDDYTDGKWGLDISRLRIANDVNGSNRIVAVMKFHQLRADSWDWTEVYIDTDGDNGTEYRFEVWKGGQAEVKRGRNGRAICNARAVIDHRRDVMRLSADRSCFDNPGAVRGRGDIAWVYDECHPYGCSNVAWDDTRWTNTIRRG